jgi:hypothetical protein
MSVKINEKGNKQRGKQKFITTGALLRNHKSRTDKRVAWVNMWKKYVKFYATLSTAVKLVSRLFT